MLASVDWFRIRRVGLLHDVAFLPNIRSQWQDVDFFAKREHYEKLDRMLKAFVITFRPDISARLKDIAEK